MYLRKTEDEFNILGNYGQGYEIVTCETSLKEAKNRKKEYLQNEPGIPFIIVKKRVPAEKRIYVIVHVYDDGNTELTVHELFQDQARRFLHGGDIPFIETDILNGKLREELISYGYEESDIDNAIKYILKAPVGESCIVGKL
jgi:hypothetical protein